MVLTLVLGLLATEVLMRRLEPHLSKDVAQIRALPATAAAMRAHPGHKVLVVGNSLTRNAVNKDLLTASYPPAQNPGIFYFVPDATSVVNWDYGLRRYFLHDSARPDELLLGTGPLHLRDVSGDGSRLGAYYVDRADFARAMHEDLSDWDEKCGFLLSRFSVIHATRARIKPHVFGRLIPHYFDIEQWINTQRDVARQRTGKGGSGHETHRHLTQLLQDCAQAGIKVSVFSVPLPEPYTTSAAAIQTIESSGARWLPLSNIPGLTSANFPDGYHLNPAGAEVFTRQLAQSLQQGR